MTALQIAALIIDEAAKISTFEQPLWNLGNPVEGERDSGLKPNTIPL